MHVKTYLKETFGYSDKEAGRIYYVFQSIASEVSKLLIMGIFFLYIGKFDVYLVAALLLCFLRTNTGGMHLKHYSTCLAMSFCILATGICILPEIPATKLMQIIVLGICAVCNYYLSPIVSEYRPIPNGLLIKKSKRKAALYITLYILLLYIIPVNPYTTVGFWIIVLQTLQLFVAKYNQRRRVANETFNQILDVQGM